MSSQTIGVVGGGAVGLTASLELARRDVAVTLFEQGRLGSGATGRAAGICYDAYVDQRDAEIAARSLDRFRELGVLTEQPYVWFARADDEVAAAIESHVDGMQRAGRDVSLVEPAAVSERFPGLVTDDVTTAAIARNAGYVDTTEYVELVAARAADAGVSIETQTPVTVTEQGTIQTADGSHSFDAVLVTAGAGTVDVLEATEFDPAVRCYRTQVLVANSAESGTIGGVPMFYDASEEWYGRPTADGVLAGDGSELYAGPPADYERETDASFRTERMAALEQRIDGLVEISDAWAGLCTATPDRDPLVGECLPGLYVATGFCGHGFMRSPAIGAAIAEQILGGDPIAGFEPTRFDGTESIELPVGVTESDAEQQFE
ncbi:FAD-dependent oxidoreductase [Halobacteriaceae archaeon SHR40]|uniref:NAD(P)/FAD-dependent oxidoreductase n=1 Tax=Halovenus amylolytica TaxID=2500550 RepID=UPI000FE3CFE1